MESRPGKYHGGEIPKKPRSLDLKSLYSNVDSKEKESPSKRKSGVGCGDYKRPEKKKSRKEVSIFKFVNRNGSKSLEEVYNGCLSMSSRDSKDTSSQGLNPSSRVGSIARCLDENVVNVPRRKRDFVGRRKVANGGLVVKPVGEGDNVGWIDRLIGEDAGERFQSLKDEAKEGVEDFKEHPNIELDSDRHSVEDPHTSDSAVKHADSPLKNYGREHLVENNGDSPLTSSYRKRSRKRKKVLPVIESVTTKAELSIDTSFQAHDDLREDDGENLEENAARMLSSRFDPSCTGFSNGKASTLPSQTGLSKLSSSKKFMSSSSGLDAVNRMLRLRRQDKVGKSKVRHNYYRIFGDMDAYWVLNRRIKVFWPLDKTWYFGHVSEYDAERKLHHIKYDDRDEEWIDLQNERFKLLLLPSEVPGRNDLKRSGIKGKHVDRENGNLKPSKREKTVLTSDDDGHVGNYIDSELIISWLAHSAPKVKPSPLHALKKKKTPDLSPISAPPANEDANKCNALIGGFLFRGKSKLCIHDSALAAGERSEVSLVEADCSENRKLLVYSRKRFRNTTGVLYHMAEARKVSASVSESDTLAPAVAYGAAEECDLFLTELKPDEALKSLDAVEALWLMNSGGLVKLNIPLMESRQLRFKLSFPMVSSLNYSFGGENYRLLRASSLLRYGVLMALWPRVYLEMLFVDNMVGLRFLLFEGSLEQVVAFVFLVLTAFHHKEQEKYADSWFPATSMRFKFFCIQDCRKQLIFAFCNFSELKNSKWMYLDLKLRRHSLVSLQLSLSECTYDNVNLLQNGGYLLFNSSAYKHSSLVEGLQRNSKQGLSLMNISRETIRVNAIQSSGFDQSHKYFPLFGLSFTAAPTLFLDLHLELLMEHCTSHISFQTCDPIEHSERSGNLLADVCSNIEDCSNKASESTHDDTIEDLLRDSELDGSISVEIGKPEAVDVCITAEGIRSSGMYRNDGVGDVETFASTCTSTNNPAKLGADANVPFLKQQHCNVESEQADLLHRPLVDGEKSNSASHFQDNISVHILSSNQLDKHADKQSDGVQQSADLSWKMNGCIIPSPNPTARRSTWHRNRSNSASFNLSHGWSDLRGDLLQNNFGSGPKKVCTHMSYTLPFGGFDYGSKDKSHQPKALPHKRIQTLNEKRLQDDSEGFERNVELLSCGANVLVTHGDRGWRECGVRVFLELFDHNEWKLAVKISGSTKYMYKAHQFLQPGSTNRYTHAMMWKGGKEWVLEFPDRSQWAVFKELHEECYNRNIRAASVKNVPIPGIRFIEENDDHGAEVPFVQGLKYFRQVQTDVEMALDPSRVLYDMDSDDERWILEKRTSSEAESRLPSEDCEDMFEKIMDMLEKAAYSQQCDQFTSDEMEEFMAGVGPMEAIKIIHQYWRQKRQRKRMPLIRHLQPPLWQGYQQEVKEWELAMTKNNTCLPNAHHEKVARIEKPLMFAFCLKPRGLEVPNRGSKQRSHRKISVAGQSNSFTGDHDHFNGRRLNGFAFGDERYTYESFEESLLPQVSPRLFSPRFAAASGFSSINVDRYERGHLSKLQRSKSKKLGALVSLNDTQMVTSFNHRILDNRNGYHCSPIDYSAWPSQRHYYLDAALKHILEQPDGSELDEFRVRNASGATQHAFNLAKLKKERAQRLLYRADLAIHKAVVALLTAEAMKASFENVNSNG